jgi:RimJ/RimL family protein N-acetyltransferase
MDLLVRAWREDDAEAIEAAVAESREHLRPWLPWASAPSDVAWRRGWIREQRHAEAAGGDRVRGAFLPDGRTIVRGGGLHRRLGPGAWEIGYWVHAAWTRRGVATALVAALCDEAFADEGIVAVEIHHDTGNAASGAVARRAGFTRVGERPRVPVAPADGPTETVWRLTRAQDVTRT